MSEIHRILPNSAISLYGPRYRLNTDVVLVLPEHRPVGLFEFYCARFSALRETCIGQSLINW